MFHHVTVIETKVSPDGCGIYSEQYQLQCTGMALANRSVHA